MGNLIINKFKSITRNIRLLVIKASKRAELQIDAFIFSKKKQPQIRALVTGTGLHIIIPINKLSVEEHYFSRFSESDQKLVKYVLDDMKSYTKHLLAGEKIKVVAKNYDRDSKAIKLTLAVFNARDKDIEFEVDPTEIMRNKFLLHLLNKEDSVEAAIAATENRIMSETDEIKQAKIAYLKQIKNNNEDTQRIINIGN